MVYPNGSLPVICTNLNEWNMNRLLAKVICTNGAVYEREYTLDDLFFNIDANVTIPLKGQIVVDYTKAK